ncbi:MAG: BadF/BadG/BcrA/BcrD ATPase family protein, partial [Candidatus Zixiibacteriota bacterium]
MNCFAGIDIGASTTKAIIINENKEVLGHSVNDSGTDFEAAAERAFGKAYKNAGLERSNECVVTATGYGRRNVPYADGVKTEVSCHAKG